MDWSSVYFPAGRRKTWYIGTVSFRPCVSLHETRLNGSGGGGGRKRKIVYALRVCSTSPSYASIIIAVVGVVAQWFLAGQIIKCVLNKFKVNLQFWPAFVRSWITVLSSSSSGEEFNWKLPLSFLSTPPPVDHRCGYLFGTENQGPATWSVQFSEWQGVAHYLPFADRI